MTGKLWKLVQKDARPTFLMLLGLVCVGGIVELGGIATTAEMMGLVASRGEKLARGPLTVAFGLMDVATPQERLRYGLVLTISVLGMVHLYTMAKVYLRSKFVWIQALS